MGNCSAQMQQRNKTLSLARGCSRATRPRDRRVEGIVSSGEGRRRVRAEEASPAASPYERTDALLKARFRRAKSESALAYGK